VAFTPEKKPDDWMKSLLTQKSIEKTLEDHATYGVQQKATTEVTPTPVAPDSPGGPDTSSTVYDALRESGSLRSDNAYVPSYISGVYTRTNRPIIKVEIKDFPKINS
jgi:hypothetical protein